MRPLKSVSADERAELLRAPTLTLADTARVLGVGTSVLRDALRRGELNLPVVSIGSRKVVPSAAVRSLLDAALASD
jgi:hypothetical protein